MFKSDDYATIVTPDATFYYGYETEYCERHGVSNESCADTDCETEWCAYASLGDCKVLVMTTSEIEKCSKGSSLSAPIDYLMAFMELYMNFDIRTKLIMQYGVR